MTKGSGWLVRVREPDLGVQEVSGKSAGRLPPRGLSTIDPPCGMTLVTDLWGNVRSVAGKSEAVSTSPDFPRTSPGPPTPLPLALSLFRMGKWGSLEVLEQLDGEESYTEE
jgi:hypothetical protein